MKIPLIALSLMVTGCAKPPNDWGEFKPYVQSVVDYATANHLEFAVDPGYIQVVRSDRLDMAEAVGECIGSSKIEILGSFWDTADESDKEVVMLHELGHCALGRAHDTTVIYDGSLEIPESIMYPYVLYESWYVPNRAYYWNELFRS